MTEWRCFARRGMGIALFFVFASLFALSAQSAEAPLRTSDGLIPVGEFEGGRAFKTAVGDYPVLRLKGSWRQMGRQYGGLAATELREFFNAISADMKKRGLSQEQIDSVRSVYNGYSPEMKDLLVGMAETSGLSLEDHILLEGSFYVLPDFVLQELNAAARAKSCSGIAMSGPRTADGKLYFARNWDMTPDVMRPYLKYLACVVFNPPEGLSFANVRPLGQVYVETGLNEAGVFVELNNGSGSDPGQNPDGKFAVAAIFDIILRSDSLDAFVKTLRDTKIDSSYLIQVADKSRAVSVEIPTFGSRVLESKDGLLYALNNFALPTPAEWKGRVVEIPAGYHDDRQVNLDRLFASDAWKKGVTVQGMEALMDMDLARGGPVVNASPFGTVIQVIAIPGDMSLRFRGYGYSGWGRVDLAALFD